MKKFFIFGAIALIVLIGIVAWFASTSPAPSPVENAALAVASPITVTALHQDVFLKEPNDKENSDFKTVAESATTTTGSTVKTTSAGRALIESGADHSTVVDYNSEVVLADSSHEKKKTNLQLVSGAVWTRLQKVFDSGEYYEIKTSNTVAVVRGTSFGLWFVNGVTTLEVTSGSVAFYETDAQGLPILSTEVLVPAGKKATRAGTSSIVVADLSATDKKTSWFIFNNPDSVTASVVPAVSPKPVSVPTKPAATSTPTQTPSTTQAPSASQFLIFNLTPNKIEQNSRTIITVRGRGFSDLKSLKIGSVQIPVNASSDSAATFTAETINAGTYDISVLNIYNASATLTNAFTITAPPPQQQVQTTPTETAPTAKVYYAQQGTTTGK